MDRCIHPSGPLCEHGDFWLALRFFVTAPIAGDTPLQPISNGPSALMVPIDQVCTMHIPSSYFQVEPQKIRRLLSELLRSDADLDAFCLDCFREIYQRFGNGMSRIQKENLLILHAPTPDEIVYALQGRFPYATIWNSWTTKSLPIENNRPTSNPRSPTGKLLAISTAITTVLCVLSWLLWPLMRRMHSVHAAEPAGATSCGALAIDDLFLVKGTDSAQNQQLALDVRLRSSGTVPNAANVTRAVLLLSDKTFQRTPYFSSASYDLLISGNRSEAALAQRLGPGEVDRIALRLGFTLDAASFQYTARLRLLYNGRCSVESAPFILSSDAAQWPGGRPKEADE